VSSYDAAVSTVTSPFGSLAVIVDPAAGGGHVASQVTAVQRALEMRRIEHRLHVATGREDVVRSAGLALDEGYRFLAAVGDDATVHDVVNGMFRDGKTIVETPVLAVLGAGSGGDLLKSFGLPDDVDQAAAHLEGEETYPFDVMKIAASSRDGCRTVAYAHNVAEVGLHGAATAAAVRLPRRLGNARRFLGFWSAYLRTRAITLNVTVDGRTRELRAWSVIVGNGQFADGGLRLSPRSFPGDGVLDASIFTGPRSDAYRLLPRMFRHGDHIPDPGITELRARLSLQLEPPSPWPVVADGELIGRTPVAFQMVPRQILLKV
jgi:diacylglycerol kinase (ATP)